MRFERALHRGRGRRCNELEHLLRRLWLETEANAHAPTRVEQVSATG